MSAHSEPDGRPGLTRRQVLLRGAGVTAGALVGSTVGGAWAWAAPPPVARAVRDPFTLGVASGEPAPDGVVLWTRLASSPAAEDGRGGMPARPVPVQWQIAEDEGFGPRRRKRDRACQAGTWPLGARRGRGAAPWRRVLLPLQGRPRAQPGGADENRTGRGARVDSLAFAFTSCQAYTSGLYTAHRRMAEEDLDLVVQLGDYIYEGAPNPSQFRVHEGQGEPMTLGGYRNRHAQYKSDTDLQAAHAAFAWVVVLDDHEIDNNWADEVPQDPDKQSREAFLARRKAALQAYYEHMPLRRASIPSGIDIQLYRRLPFGDLLDLHVLDTRQYRSDQSTTARLDPSRTILGDEQERWLRHALAGPTARWNVLAQQVFFSQRDFTAGPAASYSNDAWDGYVADRDGLRDHLATTGTSNPVVITGDVHANYVCDVKADFNDPSSRTVASELVGTSISTGGDGRDQNPGDAVQLAENPHIRFINRNRGYVRNTLTPSGWTADFRIVDSVTTPDAKARTRATYVIENGRPGAVPA